MAFPPRPLFPQGPAHRRRPGLVARILLVAGVLALLAVVAGPPVDHLFLALATCALAAAGVVSMLLQWSAAVPATAGAPAVDPSSAARQLDERLRGLRRSHLEAVDRALDAGRPDLAREISETYTDRALRLLTGH